MTALLSLAALCVCAQLAFPAGALLGAGLWTVLAWFGLQLTGALGGPLVDLAGFALAAGLFTLRTKRITVKRDPQPPLHKALLAVAALVAAISFVLVVRAAPDGGWDAPLEWNLRARHLTGANPFAAFDARLPHTDYPLLWPLMLARLLVATHDFAWMPALLAAAFAIACAAALFELSGSALATAFLLATPLFAGRAAAQYVDGPLAAYVLLAAGLAQREEWLGAGLAAGLAAWTKNDGALYVVALLPFVRSAKFAAGLAAPLAALAAFKLSPYPGKNDITSQWSLRAAVFDASRWAIIAKAYVTQLLSVESWGIGPWVAAIALVRRRRGLFIALALLGQLALYVTTPLPLAWHIQGSLDRVLLQLWPAALLLSFGRLDARRLLL